MSFLTCVEPALATEAWVPDRGARNVPSEVVIGFAPSVTLSEINSIVSGVGGKVIANFTTGKVRPTRIKLSDPDTVQEVINRLKNDSALKDKIIYVEPNMVRRAFDRTGNSGPSIEAQSNDPLLSQQWGYYDINANWVNAPTTSSGVTVAVIDTGVDYNHPDLIGKVIKGPDYVNGDKDPMDDMGHGTHVAGIIAAKANNSYGITGVSWNAKIYAIKVLDSSGYGNDYDVALGILAAANNSSVKVISMSLGGGYSAVEQTVVEYAVVKKGKLLVAAAGNYGSDDPSYAYPAAFSSIYPGRVLAVAAHMPNDCRASFSNYGSWVSISAPGYDVLSTVPTSVPTIWSGTGFYDLSGTSMATPQVAGAAALAWEKYKTYTNLQIANLLTTKTNITPLVRDGSCWPADGSTFQRLDVLHVLEQQFVESCDNKGAIWGYALDAESGAPLAGGKVTAKVGTAVATDYVPSYGEAKTFGGGGVFASGYGLFNVMTKAGTNALSIQKKGYATFTPKTQSGAAETMPVNACLWTDAGNIPVIPTAKGAYWMAVTWNYEGAIGYSYDMFSSIYQNGQLVDMVSWYTPGNVNTLPYAKLMWDSWNFSGVEDLRQYSESINIRKVLSGGQYVFFVYDWMSGPGSANWGTNGIKAYLYKGNTLVKTYTPPAGSGQFWVIADVTASKITDRNLLSDDVPGPLTATGAVNVTAEVPSLSNHPKR